MTRDELIECIKSHKRVLHFAAMAMLDEYDKEVLLRNMTAMPIEKIELIRKDLVKLYDPSAGNFCYNDAIYSRSIEQKWRMSISEMHRVAGTPVFETVLKWMYR